ncbi:tripartite tricarboxylate transporter substrate-binding protein [Reyranella sp.]|uniref:tripartite tricarboxylate transporter substrate-binding protein n=1 Tax=Reyranella sp. TaxID=1929291 RepID=UPI003D0EE336
MQRLAVGGLAAPALATGTEFIAYARAHPGKINFGSAGTGSVTHVSGELFRMMPASTFSTCPIGAPRWRSPTCWPARCR